MCSPSRSLLPPPSPPDSSCTAAAAKSLQSCPTLCNPIDGSPTGSPVPGILQARVLEWVAISFSNACMHAKSLQLCLTLQPHGQQPTRLLCPRDSLGKNSGVGCHVLLQFCTEIYPINNVVVSGGQRRNSAIHIHVSILLQR